MQGGCPITHVRCVEGLCAGGQQGDTPYHTRTHSPHTRAREHTHSHVHAVLSLTHTCTNTRTCTQNTHTHVHAVLTRTRSKRFSRMLAHARECLTRTRFSHIRGSHTHTHARGSQMQPSQTGVLTNTRSSHTHTPRCGVCGRVAGVFGGLAGVEVRG